MKIHDYSKLTFFVSYIDFLLNDTSTVAKKNYSFLTETVETLDLLADGVLDNAEALKPPLNRHDADAALIFLLFASSSILFLFNDEVE